MSAWRWMVPAAVRAGCTALLLGAVLPCATVRASAQEIRPLPGSRVTLGGMTNVGAWSCEAGGVSARGRGAGADLEAARVDLPITKFDCASDRMEADLRHALRAERHPAIVLRDLAVVSLSETEATVHGVLEVAGVARRIASTLEWEHVEGRLHLVGSLELRMTDFGVQPPRALLGLIRAHDDVRVEYDVSVVVPTAVRTNALVRERAQARP